MRQKGFTGNAHRLAAALLVLSLAGACKPDFSDDAIPYVPFDAIHINLNLPEYVDLKTDGGFKNLNEGGVRGIILYRLNAAEYHAYERNCSFQPNTACATVEVHASRLFILCPCCSSTFDISTGQPTGGQAWRPLRRYETTLNNATLTITDIIVE